MESSKRGVRHLTQGWAAEWSPRGTQEEPSPPSTRLAAGRALKRTSPNSALLTVFT